MRVLYFNKKSALFGFLLVIFILVSGYSLFATWAHAPRSQAPTAPASDKKPESQQQADLLPVLPIVAPDLGKEEFFVECRLDRDRIRSEQMETLKEIADQPASSSEVRDSAQRDLMLLSDNISKETELENMVIARGYNDAAVMILPRSATVVIQAQALPPSEVNQVKELVAKVTGLDAGSIFVIAKS